jgi:small conductance mechanosensitive channel
MTENAPSPAVTPNRWAVVIATGLLVALGVAGTAAYYVLLQYHLIPTTDAAYARLALVLGLGIVGIVAIGKVVSTVSRRYVGKRHAGLITDAYRILAYTVLALAALYAVGVNGYALLAGGTFAGLVIGLASQTALSNFVAGVVLLLARPFEPADRITLTASQFNLLMPVYPPKFYSQDFLIPGFTGTVLDIGLMYTVIVLDEGPSVSIPNSIVILGAAISHNLSERWVRVKYEVPSTVDPTIALLRVQEAVAADDWVVDKRSVRAYVNQATQASYMISVDALCAGNHEEAPRSALYIRIMRVIRSLGPPPAATLPGASPPDPPAQPPAPGPPPMAASALSPNPHV